MEKGCQRSGFRPRSRASVGAVAIRTMLSSARTFAMLGLVFGVACGPVPGGALSGRVSAAPSDWSEAVRDKRICEIEARPADPHSIQLECFRFEGGLYVQSHRWALASWWPVQSWAAVWIAHPDVRVRIGEAIYELKATRVTAAPERDAVLRFRGYESPPDGVVVFRFVPRS